MKNLHQPAVRADGKPWVVWSSGNEYLASLPGHRERVSLEAWYDRNAQSLILTITQYDESMSEYLPCWAQLSLVDCGPFFAKDEVMAQADIWADTVLNCWELGSMPE